MKKIIVAFSIICSLLVACQREMGSEENSAPMLVHKVFSVTSPETRSFLDGMSIKWSENDIINVIGVTADGTVGQHPFTLTAGENSKSGTFEGEVGVDEVTFYAVYPNLTINPVEKDYSLNDGYLAVADASKLPTTQYGIENGFDPGFGILTAVADAEGNLAFRHGMAFFKFVMSSDNVKKVTFSTTGNIRFGRRPVYSVSDGAVAQVNGASKTIDLVPKTGNSFVKGATYYLAFPPKQSKTGDLTIQYTDASDAELSLTTEAFSQITFQPGKIYNIGCPPIYFPAELIASDLTIEAEDEGGMISYLLLNSVEGAQLSVSQTEGETSTIENLVIGSIGSDTIVFSCDSNDSEDAKYAYLTLSYVKGEDLLDSIDIVITQKGTESVTKVYYYYVNNDAAINTNNYFSTSSLSPVNFSSSGTSGCGADSFEAESMVLTQGFKLNSGAYVSFATTSGYNASITFYFACRKSGDNAGARIKITPINPAGEGTIISNFNQYGTLTSKTMDLTAGTEYKIERDNKELVLVLAKVTETKI